MKNTRNSHKSYAQAGQESKSKKRAQQRAGQAVVSVEAARILMRVIR